MEYNYLYVVTVKKSFSWTTDTSIIKEYKEKILKSIDKALDSGLDGDIEFTVEKVGE